MKRKLVILAVCAWSIFDASAAPVRCTGFEESDETAMNSNSNAILEITEAGKDEVIPEGKKYLKVSMTVTDDQAWMNIRIPKDKIPAEATKITMWIKGSPDNKGRGPVLNLGNWYWNGNQPSKIIDMSEPEWVKYEFNANNFEIWPVAPGKLKINDNQHIYISYKPLLNNTGTIKFCIDDIEVE